MSEEEIECAITEGLVKLWKLENSEHISKIGIYYPSYLGYCIKKQFYIYSQGEKLDPKTLAIFATGKGIHEAVAEALGSVIKVEQKEMEIELRVEKNVVLNGRIDLLIVDIHGRKHVIEVKSASRTPDAPHAAHIMQLQIYLHALNISSGFLLYWNKRDGTIKAFKLEKSEEWRLKIMERALLLDYFLRNNKEPPKEAYIEQRNWECNSCSYYSICKPGL